MSTREPGWYPHPDGGIGYYNGQDWTEHRPAVRERAITHPGVGWVLLVLGAFIAAAAFLPWVTGLRGVVSRSGLYGGRDGIITLFLGLALAALGVAIGLKQGLLWVSVLAAIIALATFGVFLIDYNHVSGHKHTSVGSGLWLTATAAVIAFVTAIAGLLVRRR